MCQTNDDDERAFTDLMEDIRFLFPELKHVPNMPFKMILILGRAQGSGETIPEHIKNGFEE